MAASRKGEILLEVVIQGAFAKATAIDSATGMEASVVGPANASRAALGDAAKRKLEYLIRKKNPPSP
ncbi:MAG TPA: hypothetical protein VHE09_13870 [Rhizomicrobium sp.]|jgi:hypothetical protein|nr:hypothetical protein [Rhizomicrobium sp.]